MNHITANEARVIAFFEKALEEGDLNGGMGMGGGGFLEPSDDEESCFLSFGFCFAWT